MKFINKIYALIVLIVFMISNMYVISIAGNNGYIELDAVVVDSEGNNISNVSLNLGQLLIGSKDWGKTTYSGNGEALTIARFSGYTGTATGYVTVSNLPSEYGEESIRVDFSFSVLDNGNQQSCNVQQHTSDWIATSTDSHIKSCIWNNNTKTFCKVLEIKLNEVGSGEENSTEFSGCKVAINNISGIGQVMSVVSTKDALNSSITSQNCCQFFEQQGKTVTSIKDSEGEDISLSSTDLIGTNYTITASGESYKGLVYGDVTCDGIVDSADIGVIINDFLGNTSPLSKIITVAGDIQQDDSLNAGDIGLMINSFLGTLEGDILVTNE